MALYAQIAVAADSVQTAGQVQEVASKLSLSLNKPGSTPMVVLSGPSPSPSDPAVLGYEVTRAEGPRVGGYFFTAIESASDTLQFVHLIETPPGNRIEVNFEGRGAVTVVFRDGGASGAVFTTCSYVESLAGSKLSDE